MVAHKRRKVKHFPRKKARYKKRAKRVSKQKNRKKKRRSSGTTKAKRSAAAKKGWETRRRKKRDATFATAGEQRLVEHPELKGVEDDFIDKTKALRAEIRAEVIGEYAEQFLRPLLGSEITAKVVKSMTPDDWVETDQSIMLGRLRIAMELGVFDEEAYNLAEEYDVDANEVYDLWFGYA